MHFQNVLSGLSSSYYACFLSRMGVNTCTECRFRYLILCTAECFALVHLMMNC